MTQEQKLIFDALDELGGESLEGSGFEAEESGPDFDDTDEPGDAAAGRR
ncbi:MAG: hypothetical protein JO217_05060 [Acidobacteriaceae bacterium]|nr:hypothetical protein [Acidobacteriaceae bacterium]